MVKIAKTDLEIKINKPFLTEDSKKESVDLELSNTNTAEQDIPQAVSERRKRTSTLNFYDSNMKQIWFAKGGSLTREDFKKKKLMAFGFYAQKSPAIIKDWGFNTRCDVCGKVFMESAYVYWDDRKRDGSYKKFSIPHVCENCLKITGVYFISEAELLSTMLMVPDNVRYRSLFDAKDKNCLICKGYDGNCTFVNVPVKHLLVEVPVCEKHLEMFCDITTQPADQRLDDLQKQGLLSELLVNKIKAFNAQQLGD